MAHFLPASKLMLISVLITTVSSILSLFFSNPWIFYTSFGFSIGLNATFTAYPTIWLGWSVLSSKKGLVVGVAEASYRISPFIIGAIYTKLINPDNLEGYLKNDLIYFTEPVYSQVPNALIWVICINFVLGSVSILFLWQFKSNIEDKSKSRITLAGLFMHRNFWYLFFSMGIRMFFFLFLISAYKNLGLVQFNDDHFLNYVSLIAFGTCAVCSVLLGSLFDKYEWDMINYVFICIEILIVLFGPSSLNSRILFGIWLSGGLGISGMNFNSVWLLMKELFPNDDWVISIVNFALIIDTLLVNYILAELVPIYGYSAVIYSLSGFLVVSMILTCLKKKILIVDKENILLDKVV